MDDDRRARRGAAGALLAVALLVVAQAVFAATAPAAVVSEVQRVEPQVSGLELEVAGGDRFLEMSNGTGREVVVMGYDDEPYLRFLPSRVVEVNTRSPSKYANEDRYALRPVPARADSDATPTWEPVSRDGSYRWFDHRIHLMERGTPPQVNDESERTKIFDWDVPMTVGGERVRALGTLEWVPASSSGTSPLLFVGLGALALVLGGAAFALARRRRGARASDAAAGKPVEEAW